MIKVKSSLAFDDVLLVPKYSEIETRNKVDLTVNLGKDIVLKIPIVSSNMVNVTDEAMARQIAFMGGLACLHRFYKDPVQAQLDIFNYITGGRLIEYKNNIALSIGVQDRDYIAADMFADAGVKIICLDIAHAHSKRCGQMVEYIAKKYPHILLIAGTIATWEGAKFLYEHGADVIRTGIGAGSICSTRVQTGNGVPLLSSIAEVYDYSKSNGNKFKIMADGGHRVPGDCVKSLCFSHVIMLGNMLAGTSEAPGNTVTIDGHFYKEYAGSSTHKSSHIEGVCGLVPCKGPVKDVINNILQGIRSGCSYQGVSNLEDLKKNPEFVQITNAGLIESRAHDILLK